MATDSTRAKILLVDDHALFREGVRKLLDEQDDMKVVGEAQDGIEALTAVTDTKPDIVIMDISISKVNGIETTRRILASSPATRIIALSMHTDKRFVDGMLQAGAAGYVLKCCAFEELSTAIRAVLAGRIYLCPQIVDVVVKDYVDRIEEGALSPLSSLSPRERTTLRLIAEGKSSREIAEHLGLSVKTVETHRGRIMKKLGLRTVAELTKYAVKAGLSSLDP